MLQIIFLLQSRKDSQIIDKISIIKSQLFCSSIRYYWITTDSFKNELFYFYGTRGPQAIGNDCLYFLLHAQLLPSKTLTKLGNCISEILLTRYFLWTHKINITTYFSHPNFNIIRTQLARHYLYHFQTAFCIHILQYFNIFISGQHINLIFEKTTFDDG